MEVWLQLKEIENKKKKWKKFILKYKKYDNYGYYLLVFKFVKII